MYPPQQSPRPPVQPPPGVPQYPQSPYSPVYYPRRPHSFLARMGRFPKLLLGVISFWPVIYLFIFMGFFFIQFFTFFSTQVSSPQPTNITNTFTLFRTLFIMHLLTMLLILTLMALYVVDVFKNERVTQDKKALWAVVLLMGGMIAMPVYWYLYIWREPHDPSVPYPPPYR